MENTEGFHNISVSRVIETSETDFINEFYNPLLSNAVEYKRGVGYFTTNWLESAARGLVDLAESGGKAKWITSPILEEADWQAIKRGDEARRNPEVKQALKTTVDSLEEELTSDTRNAIAWMVADGLLEIQFAVPHGDLEGIFHDKFGIVTDRSGRRVAFHGSQNDSQQSFQNYEAYTVDCDWISEREKEAVDIHEARFDELWENKKSNVTTFSIPESIENDIADLREPGKRPYNPPDNLNLNTEATHKKIRLRDYQRTAVDNWHANERHGLLEMATGTGKTYTALGAMDEVISEHEGNDDPLLIVISVPMTHLAKQWADSLSDFDYTSPHFLYGSYCSDWKQQLETLIDDLNLGISDREIIITTHQTGSNEFFRSQLRNCQCHSMVIADEVHNLGAEKMRKGLVTDFDYRLGLSATPKRYYDDEGTNFLLRYFNNVVFEYTLSDAIPNHLTPYEYHPHIVEMDAEELEKYRQISHKIAKITNSGNSDIEETRERLLNKRANIIKSAQGKYDTLETVLTELDIDHLLIYTNYQQIDEVQRRLTERGVIQHRFTAEEGDEEREALLDAFAEGQYDALVAMKCLDEGVDIPSTKQAVLMASSRNPKEFVQRRGRVLRQHAESGKEKAIIHDMIVVPTMDPDTQLISSEQGILERELERFEEFANTALNEDHARLAIQAIRREYQM